MITRLLVLSERDRSVVSLSLWVLSVLCVSVVNLPAAVLLTTETPRTLRDYFKRAGLGRADDKKGRTVAPLSSRLCQARYATVISSVR